MRYAYYPGCSLESISVAYDISTRAVADLLGIDLAEIDDWNCCGATEYWSQDELTACAVIARNLALVEPNLDQVVAPCAACFLNLKKVDCLMMEHPDISTKVNEALATGGLSYTAGRVRVRHLLDVIHTDVGEPVIRNNVVKPLTGLKIAPYYGCQVVRPYADIDDSEYPMKMDEMLEWVGAKVVDYPVKTHCCSGHMPQISEPQAFELLRRLLQNAQDYQADMILCMCPMCQLNLDAYQARVNSYFKTSFHIPVLFFTQMLGIAFGLEPAELGFGKEMVSAEPVLETKLNIRSLQEAGYNHRYKVNEVVL